jgi:type II secretory pathway pseudopilin PulG
VATIRNERGFLMVELLMAIVVMTIALIALLVVFSTSVVTMRRANQETTASLLADAHLETFRAMTSRDIGIDTSASVDSTYKNDPACANSTISKTCAANGVAATEQGPTGASPHSCATINGYYPNTSPCTPSVTVTGADGRTYRVDTYVVQLAAVVTGTLQRSLKQVTVVVRDGASVNRVLARESSVFDCSTGVTPGSTDC